MTGSCKLYLTYRSEYLVLSDLCVGVRDRTSGEWSPLHAASCSQLLGPIHEEDLQARPATPPKLGERMTFYAQARRVTTGPVVAIEQASPQLLREADKRWQALFRSRDRRHSVISLSI